MRFGNHEKIDGEGRGFVWPTESIEFDVSDEDLTWLVDEITVENIRPQVLDFTDKWKQKAEEFYDEPWQWTDGPFNPREGRKLELSTMEFDGPTSVRRMEENLENYNAWARVQSPPRPIYAMASRQHLLIYAHHLEQTGKSDRGKQSIYALGSRGVFRDSEEVPSFGDYGASGRDIDCDECEDDYELTSGARVLLVRVD